jgi:hypothetical protein
MNANKAQKKRNIMEHRNAKVVAGICSLEWQALVSRALAATPITKG